MNRAAGLPVSFLPRGFSFSAVTAGIKASGRSDLALAEACQGTSAAAVFTKNRVVAAPLIVGRESLARARGRVRAVLVNSGNANCATGNAGLEACHAACRAAARLLGVKAAEVFPSSTGIIGVPLPAQKIVAKLPELMARREASEQSAIAFAHAIMTTDKRPKMAMLGLQSARATASVLGIAKGAGMIHPQLATMLVYLFTDVKANARELKTLLRQACDQSFNCISIDGDTSTNDTVLLLASGQSGMALDSRATRQKFSAALLEVCQSLAEQIVADGEGVQHVIRLRVEQARSRNEALQVARTIAHSQLVKTAWAGADPNWGRILAAAGRSGVPIDPEQIEIEVGSQIVFRRGGVLRFDEAKAHEELSRPSCDVRVKLHRGKASVNFLTSDLTAEYVHINADYST
ncbi:MAG TPA: bifunctional glutamate N-acetyltransferase/amino-acid acetyltransferase ArgJ [Terriglobales bacterium]|nr:bifunctional glutamate N-acetyltransferase/amino-acid acetyltransferase ArgJ [Terriglobales bacterium]